MKKFFLLVLSIFNGFFAAVMAVVSVDWILGGGCMRVLNYKHYEPAFFSQIWEITSYIYTWTPEDTLFRLFFFLIALIITMGTPIVLTVYFWKRFQESLDKYREVGLSIFFN